MAKSAKDLLATIRQRYTVMSDADHDNRVAAMDDLKFALQPGAQWEERQKRERGDRPCYEFNKIRVTGKRIVNDMRANRPQIKVRAVEDGDRKTATEFEGVIRNICQVSDFDTVMDYAGEYQVFAGMGAWRVAVDYSSDDGFDQDISIEPIRNPFCLYADPAASDPIKRDAQDWMLTEQISKASFKSRWPKAKLTSFEESEYDDDQEWMTDEMVRICEYWYREPVERELWLLQDGSTVRPDQMDAETLAAVEPMVMRKRSVSTSDVYMCIASGAEILEGPTKWAGREFPFVVVYGEWVVIDGKPQWCGITRFAKDAQRSYNTSRTAITETIATAPQAKFWATAEQANGHTEKWAEAHQKLYPFMLYNPDGKAPGPPVRMGGVDVPVALIQESQLASDEIKAVTGIYDASLGNRSNEQTGVAIRARQSQGEIATFNFRDNMAKGLRRTGEILVDLAQQVFDTPRIMRALGVDGSESQVALNQPDQTGRIIDISKGKFDVAVTTGPSFTTARQEAAETYQQLLQASPDLMPVIGDLVFKATDLPFADKIAERLRAMAPPQIQQIEAQGKAVPPEVQAAMAQAEQAMQQVQQHGQLVQAAQSELEQHKAEAEKASAEVQQQLSALEIERAQFAADIQKQLAAVTAAQAALTLKEAEAVAGNAHQEIMVERQRLEADMQKALADLQVKAAQMMHKAQQQRIVRVKRENGALVPEYEGA